MANKSLFSSITSVLPRANAINQEGAAAYRLSPKHALAQLAATGCLSGTYYATAEKQLDELRTLVAQVDDNVYLAKLAVYARERAYMKDMPAALLVALSKRDTELTHRVFDRIVDNGRVLRSVFLMVRSGHFGRHGLSSSLKRAFARWLNQASVSKLLSASIGNDPSLRDILRMARPIPPDNQRRALFGWLTEKEIDRWAPATRADLPVEVQALAAYRQADTAEAQALILGELSVRWDLLADAARGPLVWRAIARKMGPQALRMNLNTLVRHEVFAAGKNDELVDYVAGRIADADEIRRSRQFPYQYLAAYLNTGNDVPQKIKQSLHAAAEIACGNVPELPGPVVIGVDTSGSMTSAVTGDRGRGATSKMRCVDVASLFAAALLRRNPDSIVVPFDTQAYQPRIDPGDSILSVTQRLVKYGGGGTDCSLPLREANQRHRNRPFAGAILVSDNESWVYGQRSHATGRNGSTGVMNEWQQFVQNQRRHGVTAPKLVCIDIQPTGTTQAADREDILNIGGFSDAVFTVVSAFLANNTGRFVAEVEAIEL
ncbi:MAG: TROVE domain-containing protein [Planctomycetes bacterium]|nr:TROVE domain-containing protein [Planctomycetota bacterium]